MNLDNEESIISAARDGDRTAFEALLSHYYDVMFKFAYKWCGNQYDAQDITQDACVKLARALDSFDGKAKFSSWLYRIVINCGKDWYKKQSRHPHNPDALETLQASENSEEQLYAREVLAAINVLPEGERDALILVFSEGLSHKEASHILGCKESTISWRIHEARKKLSAAFEKEPHHG